MTMTISTPRHAGAGPGRWHGWLLCPLTAICLAACSSLPGERTPATGAHAAPPVTRTPESQVETASAEGRIRRSPVPSLYTPATALSPYLRVRPQRTGVINATDDGLNTLIGFDRPASSTLRIWDQDGRPLTVARVGSVAAVAGVHQGLLLRSGAGSSYLAPNPRANPDERPLFEIDRDAQQALAMLDGEVAPFEAFLRAESRVDDTLTKTRRAATVPVSFMSAGRLTGTPRPSGATSPRRSHAPARTAAPVRDPRTLEGRRR